MNNFILKCIVVTICISFLMIFFYPRYETIDSDFRLDKITGQKERNYHSRWH